jgi:DNA-binding PadR family transcriptional regulator
VTVERDLAPGEWSVLALLAERPAHGWALAKEMSPSGEIGRVWSVGRPLVYRMLEQLQARQLIEPHAREQSSRGPTRELFGATEKGRAALYRWLAEPVDHVREIRSVFVLKLILIRRAGRETRPLLEAQRDVIAPLIEALRLKLDASKGSERVVNRFRLETTRAVIDFIDALLDQEEPQPTTTPES